MSSLLVAQAGATLRGRLSAVRLRGWRCVRGCSRVDHWFVCVVISHVTLDAFLLFACLYVHFMSSIFDFGQLLGKGLDCVSWCAVK
ncbi:hypothetical protein KCU93_g24, partial [Aureobasidium melanogenum]